MIKFIQHVCKLYDISEGRDVVNMKRVNILDGYDGNILLKCNFLTLDAFAWIEKCVCNYNLVPSTYIFFLDFYLSILNVARLILRNGIL